MTLPNSPPLPAHPFPKRGEPSWDLALMYPLQGHWSVDDYLQLDTGLLVEYTDGFIRVLPMPSLLHQWIVRFLFGSLHDHVSRHALGEVFFAPLPVELSPTVFREPDIVFLRSGRVQRMAGQPQGADLVMEVVSEGRESRQRDYEAKPKEYAEAGITEYWIVDPYERKITVLSLDGTAYRERGTFTGNDRVTSELLPGFGVDTNEVFVKCLD